MCLYAKNNFCQLFKNCFSSLTQNFLNTSYQANETSYQVYHSVHDNFYWMSHFADPDFEYHVATGLVWIKAALLIATTPVLPYDPRDFAVILQEIFDNLQHEYGELLTERGIPLGKFFSEYMKY